MRRIHLLLPFLILLISALSSYSGDVPKYTDADLQRHTERSPDAPGLNIEAPDAQDINGTWNFMCCSGKYWGEIDLTVDENHAIKGRYYDKANKSGGTVDGTVKGKNIFFTRNKGEQDYKLTLSDDGSTMTGFFVGVHDDSVGTEVTMIRAVAQPPAGGAFTPWKEAGPFGTEMDIHWKNGLYPAVVEGRNHEGRSQFRARLEPFPKRVWWFYWWYDRQLDAYEEHKQKLIAEGFQEINLQVFTDSNGVRKYQTCWIKYGK